MIYGAGPPGMEGIGFTDYYKVDDIRKNKPLAQYYSNKSNPERRKKKHPKKKKALKKKKVNKHHQVFHSSEKISQFPRFKQKFNIMNNEFENVPVRGSAGRERTMSKRAFINQNWRRYLTNYISNNTGKRALGIDIPTQRRKLKDELKAELKKEEKKEEFEEKAAPPPRPSRAVVGGVDEESSDDEQLTLSSSESDDEEQQPRRKIKRIRKRLRRGG